MARLFAMMAALTLGACGSVPRNPASEGGTFSGEAVEAAVGTRMVDRTSTTVRIDPVSRKPRVEGVRVEFVYLGFLGQDPAGKKTIRVRYEEHKIVDGVENETADYRAEVRLDLAQGQVISFRGWGIGVVEATDSAIKFVAVWSPPPA
jgi:hypothetical protein